MNTKASPLVYSNIITPLVSIEPTDTGREVDAPDRRDGLIYDCSDELHLAAEVALATGRPLLLRGEPGTGKSSFAPFVARNLNWRYYEFVVTSSTRAQHLLWKFDAVQRLADAQVKRPAAQLQTRKYIEPGVLWWVFNQDSALRRGAPAGEKIELAVEPNEEINSNRMTGHAVVLIDELDKADPDVPNGLLVPLGSTRFRVAETGDIVTRESEPVDPAETNPSRLLVVITTNEERQLPPAFLRRCVVHKIKPPDADRFEAIGLKHFDRKSDSLSDDHRILLAQLAKHVHRLREDTDKRTRRPSTAEFLDAFRACRELQITVDSESPVWKALERVTLLKRDPPESDDV